MLSFPFTCGMVLWVNALKKADIATKDLAEVFADAKLRDEPDLRLLLVGFLGVDRTVFGVAQCPDRHQGQWP